MTQDNRVLYCTREDVQDAMPSANSVRTNRRIDRAIAAGARDIEGLCHRTFYPWTGTRYFDWPSTTERGSDSIWLDNNEVRVLTALVSGGVTIAPADYFLEPNGDGPPYNRLTVNRGTSTSFSVGSTSQRSLGLTGEFGGPCGELLGGTATDPVNASATVLSLSDSSAVGVGDLIRVDTERMFVTDKLQVSTGQTLGATITAAVNIVTVAVQSGAAFVAGEQITIDAEQMFIDMVVGNNLVVKRAFGASVLAAHTLGATIYAARQAVVARGAVGTTAASHLDNAPIYKNDPPALAREANVALALGIVQQGAAGYARTAGSGDNERESGGRGIQAIMDDLYRAYGRKGRMRSI